MGTLLVWEASYYNRFYYLQQINMTQ